MELEKLAACFRDTRPKEENPDFVIEYMQWTFTRNHVALQFNCEADAKRFLYFTDVVKPR